MMFTPYDALYGSMKNRFTVIDGKREYTLGEYMRSKAERTENKAAHTAAPESSLSVRKGKIRTVKENDREKRLTSFPMRTAVSSFVAVFAICLAVLPIFGINGAVAGSSSDTLPSVTVTPTVLDEETIYTEANL